MRFQACLASLLLLVLALLQAGIAAAQQPSMVVKLYSDGSVKIYVKGEADVRANETLDLKVKLEATERNLNFLLGALGTLAKEVEVPVKISVTGAGEAKGNTSEGFASGSLWFSSPNLTASIGFTVNSTTDLTEMLCRLEGHVTIEASGESAPMVFMRLAFLNKFTVEQMLKQANVTWVKVERLTTTIEQNRATVEFVLTIDLREYARAAARQLEEVAPKFAEEYGELVAKPIEGVTKFESHLVAEGKKFHVKIATTFVGDVYELIEAFKKGLVIGIRLSAMEMYRTAPEAPATPPPEVEAFYEYVEKVASTIENLEVVLPTKATLLLKVEKGRASFYAESPKLRLKGAKDPVDTLRAIKGLLSEAAAVAEERKVETAARVLGEVMNTTVTLVAGDPGVEVVTKQLSFEELEKARVRLLVPPTAMPTTITVTTTITRTVTKTITETKTVTTTVEKTCTTTVTTIKTATVTTTVKVVPMEVVGGLIVLLIVVGVAAAILARRR